MPDYLANLDLGNLMLQTLYMYFKSFLAINKFEQIQVYTSRLAKKNKPKSITCTCFFNDPSLKEIEFL